METPARGGWLRPPVDEAPHWPDWRTLRHRVIYGIGQVILFLALFQAYKMVRKLFIQRAEGVAYDNALDILHLEKLLHIDFELRLQQWVLDQPYALIWFFDHWYSYFSDIFYVCASICILLAPVRYRYIRRIYFLTMVVALPWYAIYPLAPPRFMQPYGFPFVDTLAIYGPNYFSNSGLVTANHLAAMPSMHVGWTTVAAFFVAAAIPWRNIGRIIGIILVVGICLTVFTTGNHYVMDAVGGWIVVGVCLIVNRALPYPLPIPWPWRHRPHTDEESAQTTQHEPA